MKIFIAASMSFAKEMLKTQKLLEDMGYQAFLAPDTYDCVKNPELNMNDEHNFKTDIMRACMNIQEKCDAILVLNYPKNKIEGYIGAHTLMELGLAYYLRHKIFLLYPMPHQNEIRHAQEVMHMRPTILHGDITQLKHHLK